LCQDDTRGVFVESFVICNFVYNGNKRVRFVLIFVYCDVVNRHVDVFTALH